MGQSKMLILTLILKYEWYIYHSFCAYYLIHNEQADQYVHI